MNYLIKDCNVSDAQLPRRDKGRHREVVQALRARQKELEAQNRALQAEYDRHRQLVDEAPVALFAFDPEGRVLNVNEAGARLLGVSPGSLVNHPFQHYLPSTARARFEEHLRAVWEEGGPLLCELETSVAEGAVQLHSVLTTGYGATPSARQRVCNTVVIDVSAFKAREEEMAVAARQARRAERFVSAFLGRMARELQSPLASIVGFVRLLQEGTFSGREEIVQQIGVSGKRLLSDLSAVLDLVRLQASPDVVPCATVEILGQVHEKMKRLAPQAEARAVRLAVDPSSRPAFTCLAPPLLERIIYYLLRHAVIRGNASEVHVTVANEAHPVMHVRLGEHAAARPAEAGHEDDDAWDSGGSLDLAIATYLVDVVNGRLEVGGFAEAFQTASVYFPGVGEGASN